MKFLTLLTMATTTFAQTYLRYNHAGYTPSATKTLIAFSDESLKGSNYEVHLKDSLILQGTLKDSIASKGEHTSHNYYYSIDLSSLKNLGEYTFNLNEQNAKINISNDPYSVFITDALRHLKNTRSGSNEASNHAFSHGGDSLAIVYDIDGDVSEGKWKEQSPKKTLDALGGWYDAGDYIKFTLTIAHTVYYLLEAYEANPKAFTKVLSKSELNDVLDEAKHGLDYLMKMHPEPDLFIIQVGNRFDHFEGHRLPENDKLDSKRPALTAISPAHMGLTAAALARGAKVFKNIGMTNEASAYLNKSISIYNRAKQPDALTSAAYEKDATNDFYRDINQNDNMALAAISIFQANAENTYLDEAKAYSVGQGKWMAWGTYHPSVNYHLYKAGHNTSEVDLNSDIDFFTQNSQSNIWGIPTNYTWASMLPWLGSAALAEMYHRDSSHSLAHNLHEKMRDYIFGFNNWGISFIASTRLDNTIENIYSQIYTLTQDFPMGAFSEGPGDRATHKSLDQYLPDPDNQPLGIFNTETAVFNDNSSDFMLQESVTMIQAYGIWQLALACDKSTQAIANTSFPTRAKDSILTSTLEVSSSAWYLFSDKSEGGASTSKWLDKTKSIVQLNVNTGIQYPYSGLGFSFNSANSDASNYDGIRIKANIPKGKSVKIAVGISTITDYDYHSIVLAGKDLDWYIIPFDKIKQEGYGVSKIFDSSILKDFTITYSSLNDSITIDIDSLEYFEYLSPLLKQSSDVKVKLEKNLIHYTLSKKENIRVFSSKGNLLESYTLEKGSHTKEIKTKELVLFIVGDSFATKILTKQSL